MDIGSELLAHEITEEIKQSIRRIVARADVVTESVAACVLDEIVSVMKRGSSDKDTVHNIAEILKKYGIESVKKDNTFYFLEQRIEQIRKEQKDQQE